MKNKRYTDKCKRMIFKKQELKFKIYKILLFQLIKKNSTSYKNYFTLPIFKLYVNLNPMGFRTKIKNRCIITGRSYSVDNNTKISRIMLKKLIDSSNFSGYFKDSW